MKKLITAVLISVMVISMSISAYAHCGKNSVNNRQEVCSCDKNCVFTDADKDGICDNCGNKHEAGKRENFTDVNGDGVCDNCGYKQSQKKECETGTSTGNSFKNHRHGCK